LIQVLRSYNFKIYAPLHSLSIIAILLRALIIFAQQRRSIFVFISELLFLAADNSSIVSDNAVEIYHLLDSLGVSFKRLVNSLRFLKILISAKNINLLPSSFFKRKYDFRFEFCDERIFKISNIYTFFPHSERNKDLSKIYKNRIGAFIKFSILENLC
jgi:hypothetical protein